MVTRGYFSKSASKYSSNKTSDFENYSHRRAILTKIQVLNQEFHYAILSLKIAFKILDLEGKKFETNLKLMDSIWSN